MPCTDRTSTRRAHTHAACTSHTGYSQGTLQPSPRSTLASLHPRLTPLSPHSTLAVCRSIDVSALYCCASRCLFLARACSSLVLSSLVLSSLVPPLAAPARCPRSLPLFQFVEILKGGVQVARAAKTISRSFRKRRKGRGSSSEGSSQATIFEQERSRAPLSSSLPTPSLCSSSPPPRLLLITRHRSYPPLPCLVSLSPLLSASLEHPLFIKKLPSQRSPLTPSHTPSQTESFAGKEAQYD